MPVTPLRPSDPVQVGAHRLLARLGQGGMGTVYLGVSADERAVAVKVLRDGLSDAEARRRFRHELDALRRVRGPHLVEVLDADVDADLPYLVTRFVPGRRLDDLVQQDGPLDREGLQRLARGLADALTALHAAGVTHRDLTPGNVLVLDGEPHVIDLGLATASDVTALTRSGMVVGTPGYLAPEQVRGEPVTPAVDVHAWGATVALAGTGRPPYGVGRPEAVLYRIVHGRPDLVGLPEPLADLVTAAMGADPALRPTAADLLRRLGGTTGAAPVTVHLPRDVDATTVLSLGALRPDVTRAETCPLPLPTRVQTGPVVPLPATRRVTAARLVGVSSGPQALPLLDEASGPPAAPAWDAPMPPYDPRPPAQLERTGPTPPSVQAPAPAEPPYGPEVGPSEAPPAHPARTLQAVLTGLAGLALVGAVTLLAPPVGGSLVLLLLVLLRAAGRSRERLQDRRELRGPRRRDPVVGVLASPWHLVLAVGDTLLSLPLLALVAAGPAAAVWLTDAHSPGLARPELTAATAAVLALATGLARRVHRPSRRLLRRGLVATTPGLAGAVVALAVLTAATVLVTAAAEGQAPIWYPFTR